MKDTKIIETDSCIYIGNSVSRFNALFLIKSRPHDTQNRNHYLLYEIKESYLVSLSRHRSYEKKVIFVYPHENEAMYYTPSIFSSDPILDFFVQQVKIIFIYISHGSILEDEKYLCAISHICQAHRR